MAISAKRVAPDRGLNMSSLPMVISISCDVCLTPKGSSIVAVPYVISSLFSEAENTSPNVNFQKAPVFHFGSFLPKVTGNEAGTKGELLVE